MQLFHALVYDGLHVGVLHAERTAARGRRRRRTRRAAVARRPTTPRTSRVDPRRPFPRPSARDCPTNGGLTNAAPPEPIDGRRAATQPTDDPRCAPPTTPPAATHRHRAPDATRLFVPPSCRTNASRAHAARANRRETRRDVAHRRSGVRTFCSSELPHECRTNASRANAARTNRQETHRDGAHRRSGVRACRHAPSPRPRRDPHVHPRHDETTPASEHTAALRALRTSRRLTLGHQTHARPSDRRADALVHSAAPVAAPRPC